MPRFALVLVLLAKPVKGLTTHYNLSDELTKHDNKAVAVATAGYIFGVLTIIRGVMISGGNPYQTVWRDLLSVAIWTVISLSLLLLSAWINRKFLLNRFEMHKELISDRNVGTGAVLAGTYIGTAFIPTHEARAMEGYKDMIVASASKDIVYSSLFTGVHGNYLAPSIAKAGMDPNNLPDGDKATMSFQSGEGSKAKAWKDVWGSGQGIGAVKTRMGAGEFIAQLRREYAEARAKLAKNAAEFAG